MRIVVLLSRFPYPLEKGDKLRAFHQIKELAKNHELQLIAINVGQLHPDAMEKLRPYCQEIRIIQLSKISILFNLLMGLLFSRLPLQVAYFYSRAARRKIRKAIASFQPDHIYCQLIRVSEYVKDIQSIPKTLDYMDALSRGMERRIDKTSFYLRPFLSIEALRLKRYEHFIFKDFDYKTIISDQDRKLIVNIKNDEISVIPNGVDQQFYAPQQQPKQFDLIFTGNMSYPPNVDGVEYLVKQVLPLIQAEKEDIKVVIAGANPSKRVQDLASEAVTVTGWVDDIRDYYAQSRIFIAPMQIGTGLQNKLLEAMSMQLPCITSSLANNALAAKDNHDILIGSDPEDYAAKVISLLNNDNLRERIAMNGYEYVSKTYTWTGSTKRLEALFLKSK